MTLPLIIIPSRLSATRLPRKPLADIHGKPMIVHVMDRAMASGIGRVVVACDSEEIKQAVEAAGGEAIMTSTDHLSGSDRIWEALQSADPVAQHDIIINLQGDMPTIDPHIIVSVLDPLTNSEIDIATLAAEITRAEEIQDPAVVKAIFSTVDMAEGEGRALYFTRATAPAGEGRLYHHIGIYAYRREALEAFVSLPPSPLEMREKLEQLRALEHGLMIGVKIVDTIPLGVDTQEHLERARTMLHSWKSEKTI